MRSICRDENVELLMYSSTRFSLSVGESEQTDARRDCRTHLSRPNSQVRTEEGRNSCFPVQLTTNRIRNHIRLIHDLLNVLTIRPLIHLYILREYLQEHYFHSTCIVPSYLKSIYCTVQHAHRVRTPWPYAGSSLVLRHEEHILASLLQRRKEKTEGAEED